ncbi:MULTISPECIES: DsbA family protein [unclassified Gordonia (in: high G+C Gram-positive bacteria)]|uniref:mycothiol-dependent nitroreductase Rv2466c family protein n=1 Tax=unclassified Gordonia (in: high G+C Gram-positive bacteria) TaxID=2657482 RepID=UPI001F0CE5D3|nr:DsbA family protein [Gordonia sp. ABSL49_1]MCH5645265.1 DsbA family protein [Gordonia sp. ABSL49_1]
MNANTSPNTPTQIECYVDPVCPFAWATSRWLAMATAARPDVAVTWRQMSLAVLNEGRELDGAHAARIEASRRAGRLFAAAIGPDESIGDLYMALGRRIHTDPARSAEVLPRAVAAGALAECGLDTSLAQALDDPSFDDEVRRRHDESQQALGTTGGSPITVVGSHAFFGPVLTSIPDDAESVRLLDALLTVASTPAFSQLERPRSGPPNLVEKGAA